MKIAITNKVMNKYNYESFFTIDKDEKGSIQIINANVLKINQVISDIALNIQNSLKQNEKNEIYISMGSLTSMRLLSGIGPKIPIKISCIGNVETDLKSEFISEGVNQTIHKVYLEVITTVNILTPVSTTKKSINNQVLIAVDNLTLILQFLQHLNLMSLSFKTHNKLCFRRI